jgi:hypothetical protein
MRHLEGVGVLPDTSGPTESWLERYIRPHVTRAIRDAVRARSTFELEHRMRRAYGSWGRYVSLAIPVLDQHGSRDRVVRDSARRHHREGDRGSPEREQESHRGSGLLRVILRVSVGSTNGTSLAANHYQ